MSGAAVRGQETCWDRGPGTAPTLAAAVTMETILRTLASVVIIAMVATGVAESLTAEEVSQSQGEDRSAAEMLIVAVGGRDKGADIMLILAEVKVLSPE